MAGAKRQKGRVSGNEARKQVSSPGLDRPSIKTLALIVSEMGKLGRIKCERET